MQEFARQAEAIFRGSERRSDLDKAYSKLVTATFGEISRVASESQKTPTDVVFFGEFAECACVNLGRLCAVSTVQFTEIMRIHLNA